MEQVATWRTELHRREKILDEKRPAVAPESPALSEADSTRWLACIRDARDLGLISLQESLQLWRAANSWSRHSDQGQTSLRQLLDELDEIVRRRRSPTRAA